MKKKYPRAVQIAIDVAGGPTALAAAIGRVPSAITQWRRVPAELVLAVSDLTGISPNILRPDLYPPGKVIVRQLETAIPLERARRADRKCSHTRPLGS